MSLPKEQTEEDIKENMKLHSFNKYVSDVISLKRELPDTRHHTCRQINYDNPQSLPTTSVILIFSNEALSAVLRTVWSLILRTPKEMLNEIILVDDGSTHEGQLIFVFHIQINFRVFFNLVDCELQSFACGSKIALLSRIVLFTQVLWHLFCHVR